MKIKTQYNPETSLVCGYFPEDKDYSLVVVIDEQNKTIDGLPYIEIEEKDQVLDKEMCVVDGKYQEYIKPLNLQIEEAKKAKLRELKSKRDDLLNNKTFSITVDGVSCSFWLRNSDLSDIQGRITSLQNNTLTRNWSTVEGQRIGLNKESYISLSRHISINDAQVRDLHRKKEDELEALVEEESTTLEDIKNFNTNLI